MSEDEIFEKMDGYLMGKLAPEAAKASESDLARHPEWQEELDLRRIEHEGMELLMEDKLRADMRRWDGEKTPPKNRQRRWRFLAGTLLLCAAALVFFIKRTSAPPAPPASQPTLDSLEKGTQPIDNQTLPSGKAEQPPTAQNDETPPTRNPQPATRKQILLAEKSVGDLDVSLGTRGSDDDKTLALADSLDAALSAKDYRRLLQLTERPTGAQAATLRYIRGWAFFKLRNFDEAEKTFEKLVSENNARLKVKAQRMLMYSLLAQFPKKEKALGKLLDEVLGTENHPFKTEAEGVKKVIHSTNTNPAQ